MERDDEGVWLQHSLCPRDHRDWSDPEYDPASSLSSFNVFTCPRLIQPPRLFITAHIIKYRNLPIHIIDWKMYYLLTWFVQQGIIGQNPVTCVTFDDTDCEITATHDVCLSIFGVYAVVCGPDNNKCGVFQEPTRIIIPKFLGLDFDQLSISLWFKKEQDKNAYILSTGRYAKRCVTIWRLPFISLLDGIVYWLRVFGMYFSAHLLCRERAYTKAKYVSK